MKVAVVGVTGMVGQLMLKVLEERKFPVSMLIPVASARSAGKTVTFRGEKYKIVGISDAISMSPDFALFSAGRETSKKYAPGFAEKGCIVIDNSSAWRMEKDVPLIVPEVNPEFTSTHKNIIANPNCSTIQLVMALAPLHHKYGISRIVVSTYQSVTGSGVKAVKQLADESDGAVVDKAYPYQINNNCLPHCGDFTENGYSTEEIKLLNETRKIFHDSSIRISATAVRIPVTGGHSESVNVELKKDFNIDDVKKLIGAFPGVILEDDPDINIYPMPINAMGKDDVFVGRIRRDHSMENSLNMWVVSDNIRKGAATNTVQIAELLIKKNR